MQRALDDAVRMRRAISLDRICDGCGRPSGNRAQCSRCSVRRCRGTSFEAAACCAACGLQDARVLRWLALSDGRVAACGNCATLAGRRSLTLAELAAEVLGSAWAARVA